MTPPRDDCPAAPDRTRDIRLPPLPGSSAPVLPAAWTRPPQVLGNEPTDRLQRPRDPREPTLAFSSPEMVHRPVEAVLVGRTPRRWPWAVLAALPVLVIVVTGIWLLLLLQAG